MTWVRNSGGHQIRRIPAVSSNEFVANFAPTANPINPTIYLNGLDDGDSWNAPRTASGQAFGAVAVGLDDSICCIKPSFRTFTAKQFVQGVISRAGGYSPGVSHECELQLHFNIFHFNAVGYEILWGVTGELNIVRWNGTITDYTPLLGNPTGPNIGAAVDGDVLRGEITAAGVITVFKNGASVGSVTDTTFPTGQPGFGFWPTSGATPTSYCWKAFTAGDLP